MKDSLPYFSPFTCDANDNIYTIPFREDRYFNAGISCIRIYSSDCGATLNLSIFKTDLGIYSIRILGDTMAILAKYMRPPYLQSNITVFFVKGRTVGQTVVLSDIRYPKSKHIVTLQYVSSRYLNVLSTTV